MSKLLDVWGAVWVDASKRANLAQLRKSCERAFKAYMKACREGYAALAATEVPLSEASQRQMLAQRRREVDTHTAYTGARTKLWRFLTADTLSATESEPLDTDEDAR